MKQLSILVIPGYKLFPVDAGGAHAQLAFLAKQQDQHSIDLVVTPQNIAAESLQDFKTKFPSIQLITIGYKKPSAVKKISAFFTKQYRKISRRDYAYQLKKQKHFNGLVINDATFVDSVKTIAAQKKYDIIQVEHSINMGLIEVLPAHIRKIFVHHEIAYTRIASDLISVGYSKEYASYISSVAEAMEISWLRKYDGVITLCREDKELLINKRIDVPVKVARPFALFDDELVKEYDAAIPPQLVFVGGESHFPNKEGLSWFLREVYSLIDKEKKNTIVKITGHWTEAFRNDYAEQKNIQFTGFIDDISSVFKNGILIVPIRIGSGIRIKVITAFAKGVPVVSTKLGISGIPGITNNENAIIGDTPESFATAAIQLLENTQLRKHISDQAFELAQKEFGEALFAEERNSFYYELLGAQNPEDM